MPRPEDSSGFGHCRTLTILQGSRGNALGACASSRALAFSAARPPADALAIVYACVSTIAITMDFGYDIPGARARAARICRAPAAPRDTRERASWRAPEQGRQSLNVRLVPAVIAKTCQRTTNRALAESQAGAASCVGAAVWRLSLLRGSLGLSAHSPSAALAAGWQRAPRSSADDIA
jgi:hypothetical protein